MTFNRKLKEGCAKQNVNRCGVGDREGWRRERGGKERRCEKRR
jgi:hypothetical protein